MKACGKYIYCDLKNKKMDFELLNEIIFANELYDDYKSGKVSEEELGLFKPYQIPVPRILILNERNYLKSKNKNYIEMSKMSTLAHELGHHLGIKIFNDESEKKADEIGADLMLDILPDYSHLFMDYELNKSKNFTKPKGLKRLKLICKFYINHYFNNKNLELIDN